MILLLLHSFRVLNCDHRIMVIQEGILRGQMLMSLQQKYQDIGTFKFSTGKSSKADLAKQGSQVKTSKHSHNGCALSARAGLSHGHVPTPKWLKPEWSQETVNCTAEHEHPQGRKKRHKGRALRS